MITYVALLYGLRYSDFVLELWVLVYIIWRGQLRRLIGPWLYVCLAFTLNGFVRPLALNSYGQNSRQYLVVYSLTDLCFTLATFLLICSFYRRAFSYQERIWKLSRILLVFVFLIVVVVSALETSNPHAQFLTFFSNMELTQNLYFTCLVLTALLFVLIERIESVDDELGLLVCGVGVQVAGPTATLALLNLTRGSDFAQSLNSLVILFSTFGMLLTWSYAITWRWRLLGRSRRDHVPPYALRRNHARSDSAA